MNYAYMWIGSYREAKIVHNRQQIFATFGLQNTSFCVQNTSSYVVCVVLSN